jgi:hypothetical protein
MSAGWSRLQEWLFGTGSVKPRTTKATATQLIDQIAHGGVAVLSDERLMALVDLLLNEPGLRVALRGNVRFLGSVSRQWAKKSHISARQRQGVLNVVQRAYPHNLAAELRNL